MSDTGEETHHPSTAEGVIKSLGLVFGDIGTSPIYTITVIFLLTTPTKENVMGILSLITWTLIVLCTVQYTWLAMSLSRKGEGGTIVLKEILITLMKSSRWIAVATLVAIVSISLFIGDGVITPAISILSAVEGMRLIPGLENIGQTTLIIIACVIAIALFSIQRKGTEKVSIAFGPLMIIWFGSLALSGALSISQAPEVIWAINPYYAVNFLLNQGLVGFFVLSEVILCATGSEALYADMGHLGPKPIIHAWYFVFVALLTNYLGQGAYVMLHPEAKNTLFEMVFSQSALLYVPFLILSIIATIIASQAMISGMFSVVYQGITTHIMPLLKVDFTSQKMRSQIYISSVNWFLLFAVIFIMFEFQESSKLAAAYGLAVTGTMCITGFFMICIFHLKKNHWKMALAIAVTTVDLSFFLSSMYKIPHGGYWSIIIGIIPMAIILIYVNGQRKLYRSLRPVELELFLEQFEQLYKSVNKIRGTALYFLRDVRNIPPFIVHTMFKNNILYEDSVIVSINMLDEPFGSSGQWKEPLAEGLRNFEIRIGYMEVMDIEKLLRDAGIREKTIFYGLEDIVTDNFIWRIFSVIKKLCPTFVQFIKLPPNKLHGVVTRVEM